jgi:hypothetical protein
MCHCEIREAFIPAASLAEAISGVRKERLLRRRDLGRSIGPDDSL